MKLAVLLLLGASSLAAASDILIVADEFPAMEVLAKRLESGAGARSKIVRQTEMPAGLSNYAALIVYIHRTIDDPAERAFVEYAQAGGRLILLHHSISSGKRKNRFWFPSFLEISLPEKEFDAGGYKYFEGIKMELVNLAPRHYITTHNVKYSGRTEYKSVMRPAIELDDSEVYLNHAFSGERTVLLGVKFREPKSGQLFEQEG